MSFDFSVQAKCNHVVDGLEYFAFENIDMQTADLLNNNKDFKSLFMQKMNSRICPRCNGTGSYHDIFFVFEQNVPNSLSTPALIQGRLKLKQDVLKFLQTIYGDNPFHPEYGIGYQDWIGSKLKPESETLIEHRTISGLDYLRSLYVQQKMYQKVDPTEQFQRVDSVTVNIDPDSPTAMLVYANIYSFDQQMSTIDYVIPLLPNASTEPLTSSMASFELLG